jgi:leucyl aminopeptidase
VTALNLVTGDLADLTVDALVIGIHGSTDPGSLELAARAEPIDAAFAGGLVAALRALGATGATGEVTKVATFGALKAPVLVAVGLGERPADGVPDETLRRAAGAAARALAGTDRIAIAFPGDLRPTGASPCAP